MKNKESFIFAVFYLTISFILFLIQLFNQPFFNIFFWIGLIIYIVAGTNFLSGNIIKNKELMIFGLIFGICSWILLLIGETYGLFVNNDIIEIWKLMDTLQSLKIISSLIQTNLPSYIISNLLFGSNITYVFFSISMIIITIIGGILGVISFEKVKLTINNGTTNKE